MDVYIAKNGKSSGPFTPHQVRGKFDRGTITADDYIWFEGLPDWIPARGIPNRIDFKIATEDQKAAIRFLGHKIPRGLMYLEAEAFIQQTASAQNQTTELSDWQERYPKMIDIEAWYRNRPHDLVVPGGVATLEEKLVEIQRTNPTLFQSITTDQLLQRVQHFVIHDWRQDAASQAQLELLASHGVAAPRNLTKGEASDMIDTLFNEVTEGQQRRLTFYGLPVPHTKHEASEMIDSYVTAHPESEERYQQWKLQNGL